MSCALGQTSYEGTGQAPHTALSGCSHSLPVLSATLLQCGQSALPDSLLSFRFSSQTSTVIFDLSHAGRKYITFRPIYL